MSENLIPNGATVDPFAGERAGLVQALENHPALAVLDDEARAALATRGRRRGYTAGAVLADEELTVRFVLSGALGSFAAPDFLCLGYFGPGTAAGLEAVLDGAAPGVLQAVVDAQVFEIPVRALLGAVGRRDAERLFARSALARLNEAEVEMTCLAMHGVGPRLARWLLRLHALAPETGFIQMSQERLSQLMGVQRTSVNAAAHPLKERKIVRYRRGRISVLDDERLKAAACPCVRPAEP